MSINCHDLRSLIVEPAISELGMWSVPAEDLLLGTAAQESLMGKYLKQKGDGPALGIFQIEPNTHADVWDNYLKYRQAYVKKIDPNLTEMPDHSRLIYDLKYAAKIARLIYHRAPEVLPSPYDLNGLAKYWKKYYNTPKGKGTVEEFVKNFMLHVV